MNIKQYTTPDKLERYCFLWSELRLVIAALALLLGGIPPVLALTVTIVPFLIGPVLILLGLSWIISGLASLYLIYRWNKSGAIFNANGERRQIDTWAFVVMLVSGINLGLVGITGANIGMFIARGRIVFLVTAVIYLWAANHLYRRWKQHGQKVF